MVRQLAARGIARDRVHVRALIIAFIAGGLIAGSFLLIVLGAGMAQASERRTVATTASGQPQMITIQGYLARRRALANGRTPPPAESRVAVMGGLYPGFDESAPHDVFGTRILPVTSTPGLADWLATRAEAEAEQPMLSLCASTPASCVHPRLKAWAKMMSEAARHSAVAQLSFVSREINRIAVYESDAARFGMPDRWASPLTFLTSSGDCEDYVIAKYWSLKMLGVAESAMRVVLVRDRITRLDHAVLAVRIGSERYILDNQTDRVAPDSAIDRYTALYSLASGGQWMHAVFVASAALALPSTVEPAGGILSLRGGFNEARKAP